MFKFGVQLGILLIQFLGFFIRYLCFFRWIGVQLMIRLASSWVQSGYIIMLWRFNPETVISVLQISKYFCLFFHMKCLYVILTCNVRNPNECDDSYNSNKRSICMFVSLDISVTSPFVFNWFLYLIIQTTFILYTLISKIFQTLISHILFYEKPFIL